MSACVRSASGKTLPDWAAGMRQTEWCWQRHASEDELHWCSGYFVGIEREGQAGLGYAKCVNHELPEPPYVKCVSSGQYTQCPLDPPPFPPTPPPPPSPSPRPPDDSPSPPPPPPPPPSPAPIPPPPVPPPPQTPPPSPPPRPPPPPSDEVKRSARILVTVTGLVLAALVATLSVRLAARYKLDRVMMREFNATVRSWRQASRRRNDDVPVRASKRGARGKSRHSRSAAAADDDEHVRSPLRHEGGGAADPEDDPDDAVEEEEIIDGRPPQRSWQDME